MVFWDLFGEKGHRVRTSLTEMGPLLLSRLMDMTDAQEGVLNIAFKLADENGLALLDMKDLQALLAYMSEHSKELSGMYGNVAKQSIGAIQRDLLVLEQQGAEQFFGEPSLKISDLMRTTPDGRGAISVLAADKLMMKPRLYATFFCGCCRSCSKNCPKSVIPIGRAWFSFSMKPTCCSTKRPRPLSSVSSRWSG